MSRRRTHGKGWLTAKPAIAEAAKNQLGEGAEIEVGWVKKIGEGLYRDVWAAPVDAKVGGERVELKAAALVPRWDAPRETDDGVRREVSLLRKLADLDVSFRIPRWAEAVEEERRTILVREFIRGISIDNISDRRSDFAPWEVIGEIAADVHAIRNDELTFLIPEHATRRAHAEACLEEVGEVAGEPVADDAIAWIRAHLPPEEPAKLIHGDLLGQNILLDFENPPALIDWEYSRLGDPAYDLAIVTRGLKRPFKHKEGLSRLLDAYNQAAENVLRPVDVQVYEVYLFLNWYLESCKGEGQHPPEVAKDRLRGLLRRIEQ